MELIAQHICRGLERYPWSKLVWMLFPSAPGAGRGVISGYNNNENNAKVQTKLQKEIDYCRSLGWCDVRAVNSNASWVTNVLLGSGSYRESRVVRPKIWNHEAILVCMFLQLHDDNTRKSTIIWITVPRVERVTNLTEAWWSGRISVNCRWTTLLA